MHAASLTETPSTLAPIPVGATPENDTHALGESIAALAARIHAATYELLVMLAEFDARNGWNTGFLSCAHWLHWRTGIDLGAAREKVRVARALPALPRVSEEMQRGRLSYAKVRALTRVATPDNEQALVDFALSGTAAHVERFVRGWRRVDAVSDRTTDEARHLARSLATWVDDDGMVVIRGRLTPEVGALVQRALEAAANTLFRESAPAVKGGGMAEEVNAAQRRADALGLIAETALSASLDAGTAGDRYQVVVHVSAETPNTGGQDAGIEVDHGALHVSAETSRRLACDASVVRLDLDATGGVLDVGRKTRTIPPSIRRALAARDAGCRFPGCTSRRCDAHHIEHWADGGATRVDNLLLLCRRHHRAVHEGGFHVVRSDDGRLTFLRPDGHAIPQAPLPGELDPECTLVGGSGPVEPPPVWDGTPFDLVWALDVLYSRSSVPKEEQEEEDGCGSCGNRSVVSKELVGALPA
ncbi:MAG: DUF222 domain-containing protein [Acidobacteria bacterium]|nr:DUF222 domain-containing protein [Acidobacteriota bacterium]